MRSEANRGGLGGERGGIEVEGGCIGEDGRSEMDEERKKREGSAWEGRLMIGDV